MEADLRDFQPSTLDDPNFPAFWRDHGSAVIDAHDGIARSSAHLLFLDELDRLRSEIGLDGSVSTPEGEVASGDLDVDATLAARIVEGARDAYRIAHDWTAGIAFAPGF